MKYQENIEVFKALANAVKPKAIIYDWDNTLVDTWPLIHASINATMKEFGRDEWSFQEVKDKVHKSMRESFPELFGDDWKKAGEFYLNSYRSMNLDKLELLDGVKEFLAIVNQKGIQQFVVSNKMGVTLRKEAKALGVDDMFFSLVGAQDCDFDKPAKDPVELALSGSLLDLSEEEQGIWFVGDTVADVKCAVNCGVRPIIFGHGGEISKTIDEESYKGVALFFDYEAFLDIAKGWD